MSWLQSHVYIATWLGLTTAVIGFVVKHGPKRFGDVNWPKSILQFTALVALGMSFAPWLNSTDKTFAHSVLALLLGVLIIEAGRHPRA